MTPRELRKIILEQSKRAHVGHIGSALSVTDIIASLYGGGLNIPGVTDRERDRFILSKGHASLALYAALHLRGFLSSAQLNSFCGDATLLGVHPEHALPGVDFCSGSLGQGLSVAAGAALGAQLQNSPRRVFALLSDAECNEGSVWEAVMFSAHRRLSNLIAIIDLNGQQALGYTRDVLDLSDMAGRWTAFGWHAQEVDGHDTAALCEAYERCKTVPGKPHVIIARTVFGKGVSFMENLIKWHYWPMSDDEYTQALAEVEATPTTP
ncbi:MAG: transketolase [Chthoniobacter sp.]|jgi:transketolase|nr:transketolase [Chthoniobacter sp.]